MTEGMPPSITGGVKPMSIARRMVRERERLTNMTDEERAWRAQWLKDQILAPEEPVLPPNYYKERYNPIRRFYRAPMDKFESMLIGPLSGNMAVTVRHIVAKGIMGIFLTYGAYYYLKYNRNDWTRKGGWRVMKSRDVLYPGDPGYPNHEERTKPSDYANRRFANSPI